MPRLITQQIPPLLNGLKRTPSCHLANGINMFARNENMIIIGY